MNRKLDVLFVHPGDAEILYQGLSNKYSAIETPTWSLLLAQSCRSIGYGVAILDCDAERLTYQEAVKRIKEYDPRLVCFVVYGQNPNAGTTKMTGAVRVADLLKKHYPEYKTCFVGSHTSALPREVLSFPYVDFVLVGEGVYALRNLLATDLTTDLQNVKGIGWKSDSELTLNASEIVVPTERMDVDLPGSAWDLLPYKNKPFDLYRSCNWHANFHEEDRSPYAAMYTSLGCRFACAFCMINLINRTDYSDGVSAANSKTMRFWSPDFMIKQFDKLYLDYGVKTIRISDELFFLDKRYFEPLINQLAERQYPLNMWTYSRVDTVRPKYLDQFKKAGVSWLAIGIEAANTKIRREVTKGTYEEVDVRDVTRQINDSGISNISNYIFGLPEDNFETMHETLELALDLNTEMANFYPAFALPGSPLYYTAKEQNWEMPKTFDAWSFHSYECFPLPTKYLSAAEVLKFRDKAWQLYFTRDDYLTMIEKKFGVEASNHIKEMTKIKLKRRIVDG